MWPPSSLAGGDNYQKNAVFLGLDENYIFTLSSSDPGGKDEDCSLTFYNINSMNAPVDDGGTTKKNHNGFLRNCVHPKIKTDGTDLFVLVVAEYMPIASAETYTGFIIYRIDGAYTLFLDFPSSQSKKYNIQYINNQRLVITGVHCPSHTEWYAMATDVSANTNLIIYYSWDSLSADIWTVASYSTLHTFAHITGTTTGVNLPITGWYAGGA